MARNLAFDVLARDKTARTFDQIGRNADKVDKKFGTLSARSKHLSAGMRVGFGAAAGALGVLGGGALFKGFIDEAREAGKVTRITENAIRATGGAAGVSADHVGKLSERLSQKQAIDDEVIQTGANMLLTFKQIRNEAGAGNDVFDRAAALAGDLSIQFGSVDSASKMLGKALNDPIRGMTALGRAGVTFSEQQKEQIKTFVETGNVLEAQKIILQEVESQVGGAAAAAADPIQRLGITWANLQESIGGAALPALEGAANWIMNTGIPAVKDFGRFVGQMGQEWADLPEWVQGGTLALAGAALAVPVAIGAFNKIKGGIESLKIAYASLSTAAKLSYLSLGVVGVALAAGAAILGSHAEASLEAKQRVQEHTGALDEQTGALTDNSRAVAQASLEAEGHAGVAQRAGISQKLLTDAALGSKSAMSQFAQELIAANDAGKVGALEAGRLLGAVQGESVAVAGAREAWERKKEALGEGTTALEDAAGATRELGVEMQTVLDLHKEAADLVLNEREAQIRYAESVSAAREAIKENGEETSLSTKKGRANQSALNAVAKAALDQAKAMEDNGASQTSVRNKVESARKKFIKLATDMGMSGTEAKKLAGKLFDLRDDANAALGGIDDEPVKVKLGLSGLTDINATFEKLKGLKGGGGVDGPGTGTSDTAGIFRLSRGEHVWTADETSAIGGHAAMMRLRKAAKAGEIQGLRSGGPVLKGSLPSSKQLGTYMTAYGRETSQIGNALGALMAKKFDALQTSGGSAGLLGWANRFDGRPYVWGGSGPGGFDCSGWVSALVNRARGHKDPFFRLGSTATFPWSGFLPGPGRVLSVGSVKNAGNGIGHMAASIGRIPSESAGGRGVLTGAGARGAFDGLFRGNVWHPPGLRHGGRVDPRRGDLPFDLIDPRGMHYAVMDRGGVLQPGRTIVDNNTGRNETVFPGGPQDFAKAFVREMKASGLTLVAVDSGQRANLLGRAG